MLTIKLDNDTELALQELAQQQGKTSEQWLKEIISQFVKEKKHHGFCLILPNSVPSSLSKA